MVYSFLNTVCEIITVTQLIFIYIFVQNIDKIIIHCLFKASNGLDYF